MTPADGALLRDIADRYVMQDGEGRPVDARTGRVVKVRVERLRDRGLVELRHMLWCPTADGLAWLAEHDKENRPCPT